MSNDETAVSPSTGSANKRNSSGDAINNTVNGIPAPSSLGKTKQIFKTNLLILETIQNNC